MAEFIPPNIQDNPTGWGPSSVPEKFKDMPYQPFSKGDRLGKISDWTGNTYQDRRYQNKYASAYGGAGSGNQYAYFHDEDENSFQLVDTTKTQRPLYQRGRVKYNQQKQQRERRAALNASKVEVLSKSQKSRERDRQRQLRKWQKNYGRNMHDSRRQQQQSKAREASVSVHPSWAVLEEMDFARLSKLSMSKVEEPKDLVTCGALEYYDRSYDRINSKTEKRLQRINRVFHTVTTTEDPVIRKLSRTAGTVYGTDTIITTLMCCTRSVYPWDIIVQRVGNKLFFDKREDSDFDILSVSETATEPPQEEGSSINSPKNLSLEATFVNHNFSQQVLKGGEERVEMTHPNPFYKETDGELASVAYRYRMYDLGNDIELVVRCEHNAVMSGPGGDSQFMTIKTFNEWDSRHCGGVDWRTKIDNQRGAVLATELKNNSFKLARWTSSALLAGSDIIKFGFVSRMNPRDSRKHTILGTQQFKPMEFATQMNLNMENAWGILRCIIDICMKLDEGKYLIMKDPNKQVVRIYDIPDDTFEDDESDESEEDSEEGDEDDDEQE